MLAIAVLNVNDEEVVVHFDLGASLERPRTLDDTVSFALGDLDMHRDELWKVPQHYVVNVIYQLLVDVKYEPPSEVDPLAPRALRPTPLAPELILPLIRAAGILGRPMNAELVRPYLAHPDPAVRLATIRSLGQMGDFADIPLLEPFLADPDLTFRREAIVALGKFPKAEEIPKIDASARPFPELGRVAHDARQKILAINAADADGYAEVVLRTDEREDLVPKIPFFFQSLVRRIFDQTSEPVLRLWSAYLLSLGCVMQAIPVFVWLLAQPGEPLALRVYAAAGLGRCRAVRAVSVLIEQLARSSEPELQRAAIIALGQIGRRRALEPLLARWDEHGGAFRGDILLAARRVAAGSGEELLRARLDQGALQSGEPLWFLDETTLIPGYRTEIVDAALASPNAEARRDAALLLVFFGPLEERVKLDRLRFDDPDLIVRDVAIRGYGGFADLSSHP